MSSPNEGKDEKIKKVNLKSNLSLIGTFLAILISGAVSYYNVLKPFELEVRIDNVVQIQHKIDNFGIYIDAAFFNNSPRNGKITQTTLILYKSDSKEDKYLLELMGFMIQQDRFVYAPSEEKPRIYFKPWEMQNRVMNFIYLRKDEQFPIMTGTYICELLIWIDDSSKPKYIKEIKFQITPEILEKYQNLKERGSTNLLSVNIVGYTPLISKKLSKEEYNLLR